MPNMNNISNGVLPHHGTDDEQHVDIIPYKKVQHDRPSHMSYFGAPTVWLEFTPLAKLTSSINLGQGAPGWEAPDFVKDALVDAVRAPGASQYAPPGGNPVLVQAIREEYFPRLTPTRPTNGRHMPVNGTGDHAHTNGNGVANGNGTCNGHGIGNGNGTMNGNGVSNGHGIVNGNGTMHGNGVANGNGHAHAAEEEEEVEELVDDLDVLVTNGASQAISLACQTLLSKGDEVVVFEPTFDLYTGLIHSREAVPIFVPLLLDDDMDNNEVASSALRIDFDALRAVLSVRTRMLILNSPHNPTGKVFTRAELRALASTLDELAPHCIVLSDEVYERIVFGNSRHVSFASVCRTAYARTLSVFSCGKTFSATGLKVGWIIGTRHLLRDLKLLQQYVVFAVSHHTQLAVASSLRTARTNGYYDALSEDYERKRDILVSKLKQAGLSVVRPDGTFFVCTHIPPEHPLRKSKGVPEKVRQLVKEGKLEIDSDTMDSVDYNVCRRLVTEYGVVGIPLSVFLGRGTGKGEGRQAMADCFVRFGFCQGDEVLEEAGRRLEV